MVQGSVMGVEIVIVLKLSRYVRVDVEFALTHLHSCINIARE